MSTNYVRGSSITAAASQAEIQDLLARSGATDVRCASEDGRAAIAFASGSRHYRIVLSLPRPSEEPLRPPSTGQPAKSAQEGARQRWRALAALVRAKLEAVDSGIVTFDQEFVGYRLAPYERPAQRTGGPVYG